MAHSAGDGEKAAGAGADTRQAMSERRRAPGEHGRLLMAEKAAGAGADTQLALPERRRPLGEEHGRAADGGNNGSETE